MDESPIEPIANWVDVTDSSEEWLIHSREFVEDRLDDANRSIRQDSASMQNITRWLNDTLEWVDATVETEVKTTLVPV